MLEVLLGARIIQKNQVLLLLRLVLTRLKMNVEVTGSATESREAGYLDSHQMVYFQSWVPVANISAFT